MKMHEYQKKGVTEEAFRKSLILKDAILLGLKGGNGRFARKKREQAPALQTQLSTGLSIAQSRGKSRKIFRQVLERKKRGKRNDLKRLQEGVCGRKLGKQSAQTRNNCGDPWKSRNGRRPQGSWSHVGGSSLNWLEVLRSGGRRCIVAANPKGPATIPGKTSMEKKNEKAATVCTVAFPADARSGDGAERLRRHLEVRHQDGEIPGEA